MSEPFKLFWSALALMAGAAVVTSLWQAPELLRTEVTAAWVQALGSILAIWAVFVAQRRDHKRIETERRQEKEARSVDEQEALFLIATGIEVVIDTCKDDCVNRRWDQGLVDDRTADLASLLQLLSQIRIEKLPNRRSAIAMMAARKACVSGSALIAKVEKGLPSQPAPDLFDFWDAKLKEEMSRVGGEVLPDR